ncbi:hypothetical protein AAFF_G00184310 [Aldrovandia affinis]|uniref:General transcription factor IIA, 1-like n=1 Tax=Aldrovandia affinis TaxID=143900 RepID=A0AAD7W7F7_9TELE|nr:hypothetical protein AAFF_G00184310 [Aldrovandia affinis]
MTAVFKTFQKNTGSIATFSLPPGMSYPVQIPAGVTLQTSSGHLYKVNVPVMVTQAPGGASRILSQPVQHVIEAREPTAAQRAVAPSVLHTAAPQAPAGPCLHPPEVQQQHVFLSQCALPRPTAPPPPLIPQAPVSPGDDQFTLEGIEFSPRLLDTGLPSSFPAQLSDFQAKTGQMPASGSEVGVQGETKGDVGALAERADNARPEDPAKREAGLSCDYNHNVLEDIVQLDGACGGSSDEGEGGEEEEADGVTENEFLGMINAEALRALQEGEGSTGGGSSDSSDAADEFAEEEDPLNSGDDVSEQDIPDLFDTDNVVVCQYDKIHRSKNRWKFYLKDGVMCFAGKDYVFSKAVGEAEW